MAVKIFTVFPMKYTYLQHMGRDNNSTDKIKYIYRYRYISEYVAG